MFIRFQLISALVNIVVPSQNVVHNFTCHILKGLDFLQSQKIMHRSVRPPASSTARWPRRWTEGTAASRRSELQDSMDGCECEQPSYQVVNRGPDGYDCNWVCFGISFQQEQKKIKMGFGIKNDENKDAGVKERKDELSSPRQASQQSKARAVPTENILGRGRVSIVGKELDLQVTTHSFKQVSLRGSEELK